LQFTSGKQQALHKTLFSCIKFSRFSPLILKNLLCKTAFYANLNFKTKIDLRLIKITGLFWDHFIALKIHAKNLKLKCRRIVILP